MKGRDMGVAVVPEFMKKRMLLSQFPSHSMPNTIGRFHVVKKRSTHYLVNEWQCKRTRGNDTFFLVDPTELDTDHTRTTHAVVALEQGRRLFVALPVRVDTQTTLSDFFFRPIDADLAEAIRLYSDYVATLHNNPFEHPDDRSNDDDVYAAIAPQTRSFLRVFDAAKSDPCPLPCAHAAVCGEGEEIDPSEFSDLVFPFMSFLEIVASARASSQLRAASSRPSLFTDSRNALKRKRALDDSLVAIGAKRLTFSLRNPTR